MAELQNALLRGAAIQGERIAMSDDRQSLTRADLAAWVAGAAEALRTAPETIGLIGENGVAWAVALLAASAAGKTIVPIPTFFSREQIAHLAVDAGIEGVLAIDPLEAGQHRLPVPVHVLSPRRNAPTHLPDGKGGLIIYTSGSTGRPKGVRLVSDQALWSAQALAKASGATAEDKYLSVLPLPMLLELICGVMIPVLVGGSVHYDEAAARSAISAEPCNLADAMERQQATTTVLVPQLLALYTAQLAAAGKRAPERLRFVAVGGAPIPLTLATAATKRGIPVYEGYGLSECCSVVAVNRPGAARTGTVGKPLPGLQISIEDGEIVVAGPSVMDGYLHAPAAPRRWHTGDLGQIDADGYLTVHGRRDNLIVLPNGRNISPEWIETMLLGDLRVGACVLGEMKNAGRLGALVVPSRSGERWFDSARNEDRLALVARACETAPDYALPKEVFVCTREEAVRARLFTPNGRIRRTAAQALLNEKAGFSQFLTTQEVTS